MTPEFHVFLPQMRMTLDALVERARSAEAAGFRGIALMDHLTPPAALDQPMYEAMVTATWLAARTERLTLSHLVLCDSFRHPALLARQAVSIDHASGGRYELGIGSGSVPAELETFGVGDLDAKARVRRLGETLEVLRALWSGQPVDYHGEFHHISAGMQRPVPLGKIPIVVGGIGPRTMKLVAAHADWWNVPTYGSDRLEAMRPHAGNARTSTQHLVTYIASESVRRDVSETAIRRFGAMTPGPVIGDASQLVDHFGALNERGVERFYTWFTDFASPDTLAAFGENVIAVLGRR
ncbi:MAG TPA: LLM class flavin-dependent oxidoreductase [Acidimicrobiales bacterium]|nr:LLM class flavin-dependent oxidoreductase [Acidimicrobiales bacterium]